MTIKFRHASILAAVMLASLPLSAAASTPLAPGYYSLMMPSAWNQPAKGACLIQGNNGTGGPVRFMWDQPGGQYLNCGFALDAHFFDNGQALFDVIDTKWTASLGERGYILRNKRSGQCLQTISGSNQVIFYAANCNPWNQHAIWLLDNSPGGMVGRFGQGSNTPMRPLSNPSHCLIYNNNGHDIVPTLYRWTSDASDQRWCGIGNLSRLYSTGQGLWWIVKQSN